MNRKEIVKRVIQERRLRDIVFLLWYGDRKGKDVDLLVVLKDGFQPHCYEMAKWDILEVNNKDFKRRLELFDPVITESVISGVLLLGNQKKFAHLKKKFLSVRPFGKAIRFLLKRADEELENAAIFLERYRRRTESRLLLFALLDLSFVCSYFEFAKYYQNNPNTGPISFSKLLTRNNNPILKKVHHAFKRAKSGRKFSGLEINSLIQEVKKLIRGD